VKRERRTSNAVELHTPLHLPSGAISSGRQEHVLAVRRYFAEPYRSIQNQHNPCGTNDGMGSSDGCWVDLQYSTRARV